MKSEETRTQMDNWYVRLNSWDNRIGARLLLWLAAGMGGFAGMWRGKARVRIEGMARFCRNLAQYIVQPEIARLIASPDLLKKTLMEAVGFTFLLVLATTWTLLSVYGYLDLNLIAIVLLVAIFSLLFTNLINLLAISGDAYQQFPDESQRQLSHQASAATLRVVGFVLVVLSLCLAWMPGWRAWAALDLSILVLLARLIYLTRLAQLRWAALALVSLEDESETRAKEQ